MLRLTQHQVMAGQGTMFLELFEDHPDIEAVIVPVGGGGMLRYITRYPRRAVLNGTFCILYGN